MTTYTDRQKACIEALQDAVANETGVRISLDESEAILAYLESTSPITGFSEPDGGADVRGIVAHPDEPVTMTFAQYSELAKRPPLMEGYALVPIEPTGEMIGIAHHEWDNGATQKEIWRAMIKAAPAPSQPAAPADELPIKVSDELHPDTAKLVRRFARALANKLLASQRKYGYGASWTADDWQDKCRADLMNHIAKGDPRDVAAYCAFMWHHDWSTAAPSTAAQEATLTDDDIIENSLKYDSGRDIHRSQGLRVFSINNLVAFVRAQIATPKADSGASRWIAVADQEPPRDTNVLVTVQFDHADDWRIKVGGINGGSWTVYGASWTPSHWQPLPAAPGKLAAAKPVSVDAVQAAFDRGLKAGNEQSVKQQECIHRLQDTIDELRNSVSVDAGGMTAHELELLRVLAGSNVVAHDESDAIHKAIVLLKTPPTESTGEPT
jgi:hypothetical protein